MLLSLCSEEVQFVNSNSFPLDPKGVIFGDLWVYKRKRHTFLAEKGYFLSSQPLSCKGGKSGNQFWHGRTWHHDCTLTFSPVDGCSLLMQKFHLLFCFRFSEVLVV